MKALKALGIVLLVAAAFGAGVVTALIRGWGDRPVKAELVNQLDQPIRSFTVRYTTCGSKVEITGGELLPGKSRTVRFSVCGEGGYVVEATLADGTIVTGTEGYVQSGDSTTEIITTKGIASTQRMYAL